MLWSVQFRFCALSFHIFLISGFLVLRIQICRRKTNVLRCELWNFADIGATLRETKQTNETDVKKMRQTLIGTRDEKTGKKWLRMIAAESQIFGHLANFSSHGFFFGKAGTRLDTTRWSANGVLTSHNWVSQSSWWGPSSKERKPHQRRILFDPSSGRSAVFFGLAQQHNAAMVIFWRCAIHGFVDMHMICDL